MDYDKQLQRSYREVVEALEKALFSLKRLSAEVPDAPDDQARGMFPLGRAGGLAFRGRLPGIKSEALFDDISDAAELRDAREISQIRSTARVGCGRTVRRAKQLPTGATQTGHSGRCSHSPFSTRRARVARGVIWSASRSWWASSSVSSGISREVAADSVTAPSRTRCWLRTTETPTEP